MEETSAVLVTFVGGSLNGRVRSKYPPLPETIREPVTYTNEDGARKWVEVYSIVEATEEEALYQWEANEEWST
jgi:hypothetical protein